MIYFQGDNQAVPVTFRQLWCCNFKLSSSFLQLLLHILHINTSCRNVPGIIIMRWAFDVRLFLWQYISQRVWVPAPGDLHVCTRKTSPSAAASQISFLCGTMQNIFDEFESRFSLGALFVSLLQPVTYLTRLSVWFHDEFMTLDATVN